MADIITGPRLEAKSGRPKQLVVFLHGYGADGKDLIEIGRQWRPWLPDAAFAAPNAPEPCGMAPTGRQWFPLAAQRADEAANSAGRWAGVVKAAPGLHSFLDAEQIGEVHAAGARVLPWTANEENIWQRLLEMGVDGITTDYPDRLAKCLREWGVGY